MKNTIILLLIFTILFTVSSCAVTEDTSPQASLQTSTKISNLFDATEINPGDIIMDINVKKVEVTPWQNGSNYSAKVEFEGQVKVSGTFKINKNDEFLGSLVSFIILEESTAVLPKLANDTRYTWFVFENTDKAKDIFSSLGEEGLAAILIDNYIINYAPSDVYNTAVLIDLIASLDISGTYEGTLPCTDCPGLQTSITLNSGNTFYMKEIYLESDTEPIITEGIWTLNKDIIIFTVGDYQFEYKVISGKEIRWAPDGIEITGTGLNWSLFKLK